jgi:hypothetical protein
MSLRPNILCIICQVSEFESLYGCKDGCCYLYHLYRIWMERLVCASLHRLCLNVISLFVFVGSVFYNNDRVK